MIHFSTLNQILNTKYSNLVITSECGFDGYVFTCEYTGKHQDQTRFTLVYKTPICRAICTFSMTIYDKNGIRIEERYESCKAEDSQKTITKFLPKNIK
jgi:hypothetical protein